MQATKLQLTTWFQAFYLIGQAKTGISSLELSRHLGVKYDTAWLLHNKVLRAMTEREDAYVLRGPVAGFSSDAVGAWAREHLAPGSAVLSDGLACFPSVTTAGCSHEAVVTGGKHPNDLPQFRWINTLLGNLKTSFSGTFHAFHFDKYARRYLGGFCFRFNRHFSLVAMTERIANAVCVCKPCPERALRVAEAYG